MSETSVKIPFDGTAKVKSPVEEKDNNAQPKTVEEEINENGEAPYTDVRSVTISRIQNYSKFREVNRTFMPKRVDYIGSSILSSRMLASNEKELIKYFPNILGITATNPNFMERVKAYLNNIQIKVDEIGKTFDTSFRYNHKKDYDMVAKREAAIEERYKLADKTTTTDLKKALNLKINEINNLEIEKCEYGEPVNVVDYLMYRHCLYYSSIAKEPALINEDPNIRFYFKDDKQEADKAQKYRMEINKAKGNFVQCIGDEALFEAVYIQYCLYNNIAINYIDAKTRIEKETELDRFSQAEPAKFNKFFNDKNIAIKALIEKLIIKGFMIRSEYNQNITDLEGNLIGANINEVVAWFKNPANNTSVNNYKKQLKLS